jgi:ribonucleoside-diphosphate reductase beta chain
MVRERPPRHPAQETQAGGVKGNWGEVWDSVACRGAGWVDKRENAKAANDVPEAGEAGDDMFTRAGLAAE